MGLHLESTTGGLRGALRGRSRVPSVLMALLLLVIFGVAGAPAARAATGEQEHIYTYWNLNGMKAWNLDAPMRVLAPSQNDRFYSQTFDFDTGGGGYLGLQQSGTGQRTAIFSLWRDGLSGTAPWVTATGIGSCESHPETVLGSSRLLPLAWSTGTDYLLRLWRTSNGVLEDRWGAWVIQRNTGQQWKIAEIGMGRNWVGAALVNHTDTFVEDFTSIDTCVPPTLTAMTVSRPLINAGAFSVAYAGTDNGSACAKGGVTANSAQTSWTMRMGSQPIELISLGKCLDVANGSAANGTLVHMWDCHGGLNQKWVQTASGELRAFGGLNKCLDVRGPSSASGTLVQIWDCVGVSNQKWSFGTAGEIRGYAEQVRGCARRQRRQRHPGAHVGLPRRAEPALAASVSPALRRVRRTTSPASRGGCRSGTRSGSNPARLSMSFGDR